MLTKIGKPLAVAAGRQAQVTNEHVQRADGGMRASEVHTAVIPTQHAEPSEAPRSKAVMSESAV